MPFNYAIHSEEFRHCGEFQKSYWKTTITSFAFWEIMECFRSRASRNARRQAVFVPPPFFFPVVQPPSLPPAGLSMQNYPQTCPSSTHMEQMETSQQLDQAPVDSASAPPQRDQPLEHICRQMFARCGSPADVSVESLIADKSRTPLFDISPRTSQYNQ